MASWLSTVRGQPTATRTLERAITEGRVHHAYLFDGPEGVGKETCAFGFAQALVCERRSAGTAAACGTCGACLRAVPRAPETRPVHPDVVVLERGLYEPGTIGRRTPELQDISIDQVRTLVLARAAFPPHEGRAKVFIVRRAEELSTPAANALLKTLEEPGPRTHFVLLSSASETLLPTILSRVLRVRFGSLPDDVLVDLLAARGVAQEGLPNIVRLAAGSMTAALRLVDPEANEARSAFVSRALAALASPGLAAGLEMAEDGKKMGKDVVVGHLRAFGASLAGSARSAATRAGREADVATARVALALTTVQEIEGNASVQLALEGMFIRMRAV